MFILHEIFFYGFFAAGVLGLIGFGTALSSKKGGPLHLKAGGAFVWAAWGFALSALGLTLIDLNFPSVHAGERVYTDDQVRQYVYLRFYLVYLALILITEVRHGISAIRFRSDRVSGRKWIDIILNVFCISASVGMVVYGISVMDALFTLLCPLGAWVGIRNLYYHYTRPKRETDWMVAHLLAMSAGGFTVFAGIAGFATRKFNGFGLWPELATWPWLIPLLVGIPAAYLLIRRYRPRSADGVLLN